MRHSPPRATAPAWRRSRPTASGVAWRARCTTSSASTCSASASPRAAPARARTSGRADLLTRLHGLEREIGGATAALRATLRSLDTPAPSGAVAVKLREGAAAFTTRTSVPAHLLVLGEAADLDPVREELLVRVAHEGMRNVERHAEASEVIVTLCYGPDWVELVLQDDGVRGLTSGNGTGLGLSTLREEIARVGGELRLAANEDTGSTLRARLLLK